MNYVCYKNADNIEKYKDKNGFTPTPHQLGIITFINWRISILLGLLLKSVPSFLCFPKLADITMTDPIS